MYRGWFSAAYGTSYIWRGLIGSLGVLPRGPDFQPPPARLPCHVAGGFDFPHALGIPWTDTELWIYGLPWSIGFLGFGVLGMILTAEIYPARIRGAGNGFAWATAWLVGFVLWPFVTAALTERTGSFAAPLLIVPVAMLLTAVEIFFFTPDYAGKGLDSIAV